MLSRRADAGDDLNLAVALAVSLVAIAVTRGSTADRIRRGIESIETTTLERWECATGEVLGVCRLKWCAEV